MSDLELPGTEFRIGEITENIDIPYRCGHCGVTLGEDATLLAVEVDSPVGGVVILASDHAHCLTEWGIAYENGSVFHIHDVEE